MSGSRPFCKGCWDDDTWPALPAIRYVHRSPVTGILDFMSRLLNEVQVRMRVHVIGAFPASTRHAGQKLVCDLRDHSGRLEFEGPVGSSA
jgi:hypothetical protein